MWNEPELADEMNNQPEPFTVYIGTIPDASRLSTARPKAYMSTAWARGLGR
jgi:hypothetical protein